MSWFHFKTGSLKQIAAHISTAAFCFILLYIFPQFGHADNRGACLEVNECIEDFSLLGEICREDRTYLGLKKDKASLCDISCKAIWVEVFSIYCPQCQALVPELNDLYKLINEDPFSRTHVKMLGIGAGCSDYEVKYFRNFYDVRFPLFPDPDFRIHKMLKNPKTPFVFFGKQESKKLKVLAILDPTKPATDQFEHLKIALHSAMSPHERCEAESEQMLLSRNCNLWNHPDGEIIACLFEGFRVKKIKTVGTWCKIETLDNDGNVQGWLRVK